MHAFSIVIRIVVSTSSLMFYASLSMACVNLPDQSFTDKPIPQSDEELYQIIYEMEDYVQSCQLARSLEDVEDHSAAAVAYGKAANLAQSKKARGYALQRQGLMYFYSDVLTQAMQVFLEVAEIGESISDVGLQIEALSGRAGIMTELGRSSEAVEALDFAISLALEKYSAEPSDEGRRQLLRMHYNKAIAYQYLKSVDGLKRTISDARRFVSQADPPFMFGYLGQLAGHLARLEGNYEHSENLLQGAFENIDTAPSPIFRLNLLYEMVLTYEALGDGVSALKYAQMMDQQMQALPKPLDFIGPKITESKARAYSAMDDDKKAASHYLDAYLTLKKEQQQRLNSELIWLNDIYDREVRRREIQMLRQETEAKDKIIEQQRYLVALSSLLFIALLLFGIFRARQLKEREVFRQTLASEKATRDERLRISRELHDNLLQGVMAVSIHSQRALNWLNKDPAKMQSVLQDLVSLSERTAVEGRKAIETYRHADDTILLKELVKIVAVEAKKLAITLKLPEQSEHIWQYSFSYDIGQIFAEATRNALKHSEASQLSFTVEQNKDAFTIIFCDNGKGFDQSVVPIGHWGLLGMQERALNAGAELDIHSDSDGTRVSVVIKHS